MRIQVKDEPLRFHSSRDANELLERLEAKDMLAEDAAPYVWGNFNKTVKAGVEQCFEGGEDVSSVILMAPTGNGKSAMARELQRTGNDIFVMDADTLGAAYAKGGFIYDEQLWTSAKAALENTPSVVFVDGLQLFNAQTKYGDKMDGTQKFLAETINFRKGKPELRTIIATQDHPDHLTSMGAPLQKALRGFSIYPMGTPTEKDLFDLYDAAAQHWSQKKKNKGKKPLHQGAKIPAYQVLARYDTGNIKAAMGQLGTALTHAATHRKFLTARLVSSFLEGTRAKQKQENLFPGAEKQTPEFDYLDITADETGVPAVEILKAKRQPKRMGDHAGFVAPAVFHDAAANYLQRPEYVQLLMGARSDTQAANLLGKLEEGRREPTYERTAEAVERKFQEIHCEE